ncbi:MAG TPA: substrate-binding domain-containing protein [Burkholderiales bacterium]|nr:substrate-binding domain-containing protein [Burkholderiales bacterium]
MKNLLQTAVLVATLWTAAAAAGGIQPPWNPPPEGGKNFTVPGIDNVPDLYGDVVDPQLVVFLAGNQYMVVDDLLREFRAVHPQYQRIFVETLPPGILIEQIEQGALIVGNMRLSPQPDVYATGRGRMEALQRDKQWFSQTADYARNRLAIMTSLGNPQQIAGWSDLARAGLTICMPNPQWEGVAANVIIPAIRTTGGEELVRDIYTEKVRDGSAVLTQIHHRQTPLWIMQGKCVAGAVWYTEAYYHAKVMKHAVSMVELPDAQNRVAIYTAGVMKTAPHRKAAEDFLRFLQSAEGQAVYRKYGFLPPG